MSDRPTIKLDTATPSALAPRSSINKWLVLASVTACLAGGLAIAGYELFRTRPGPVSTAEREAAAAKGEFQRRLMKDAASAAESNLIDDDGETLWASPTSGKPIDLAYLPPGSQIIVALRPAMIANHEVGAQLLESLGPLGASGVKSTEEAVRLPFGEIDRLVISCQATSGGQWLVAMVAHVGEAISPQELLGKLPDAAAETHAGGEYWLAGDRAYVLPEQQEGKVLVVAPKELVEDVLALGGEPPPLRRDLERLIPLTDADRPLTIVYAPNFLFGEGESIFDCALARLREPLFWFLGDTFSAAAFSIQWDESFFVELLSVPTLDTPPEQARRQLAERVAQLPDLIEEYVLRLNPQPYGRRVVARFPAMVRKLVGYTRSGLERDHVVLRSYLPAVAGHNFLLGAELTLAETPGVMSAATNEGGTTARPPAAAQSVGELLKRPTSLQFTRDSLEGALDQLSKAIGVEIVIVGPDLQADGITRNQQLSINLQDRPAAEILVEVLRAANPDKSASGPQDEQQKLVYVVKSKSPEGAEAVFVTTRAAAKERGETLPAAFQQSEDVK